MKVFLTSASGYVGAAIGQELLRRGHAVMALARRPQSVERLCRNGILPVPGELARAETYRDEAAHADVVVHTAFEYAADGAENLELDDYATRTLLCARRLIYTSNGYLPGVDMERLAIATGRVADRSRRLETERLVLATEAPTSNAVIRLGMVYGGHGGGTICSLFAAAQGSGLTCPADFAGNRWSLIELRDLASLYATLAETPTGGVFHAVDGRPLAVRRVLECVGDACGASVSLRDEAAARDLLDSHAVDVMKLDVALDSPRARALGWSPRYRDFAAGVADAYRQWSALETRAP